MKIGIVTIYEPITNMGSFLQAYAMKRVIEAMGHEVYFIENVSAVKTALKCVIKINPKREFVLRIKKTSKFFRDIKKIKRIPRAKVRDAGLDLILYGSDEIWNMENPYFRDQIFFGGEVGDIRRVAYAVSVGAMTEETLYQNIGYIKRLPEFKQILVRDEHTRDIVSKFMNGHYPIVGDPTLLVPVSELSAKIQCPKEKYLLAYTYGLDKHMEKIIVDYARKHHLKIVSPCFWHLWADQVIECSALQFSSLIQGAECVFTSTFHGAIFTLLNHKRCCILPVREKVRDIVIRLGKECHLIENICSAERFEETMSVSFQTETFERKLLDLRDYSLNQLKEALKCLES